MKEVGIDIINKLELNNTINQRQTDQFRTFETFDTFEDMYNTLFDAANKKYTNNEFDEIFLQYQTNRITI